MVLIRNIDLIAADAINIFSKLIILLLISRLIPSSQALSEMWLIVQMIPESSTSWGVRKTSCTSPKIPCASPKYGTEEHERDS